MFAAAFKEDCQVKNRQAIQITIFVAQGKNTITVYNHESHVPYPMNPYSMDVIFDDSAMENKLAKHRQICSYIKYCKRLYMEMSSLLMF